MTTETAAPALTPHEQQLLNANLLQAARDGDPERVRRLIGKGAGGPQAPLAFPFCEPFFNAVRSGDLPMVEALLPVVSIDAFDSSGASALMLAAIGATANHDAIAALLLENGANPCLVDDFNRNALLFAVSQEQCSLSCVQRLLPLCDAAAVDALGNHALIFAARTKMPAETKAGLFDLLLPLCDPKAPNSKGTTALMAACSCGDAASARRLMPLSDVAATNEAGRDAVDYAAGANAVDLAAELRAQIDHQALAETLAASSANTGGPRSAAAKTAPSLSPRRF
jgi:ankyrin repeat protein